MSADRLTRQIGFLLELDRAKSVLRRNRVGDGSRRENDAEHSWHLAMMALVLAEHASEDVDVGRVVGMLLVHDIVEIDAGDTFVYDADAHADKEERERAAADRIFAMLPSDQGGWLRDLWEEFEARETPEARFARAVDRLQPLLLNHATRGVAWQEHGVTGDQVLDLNSSIVEGSETLWDYARGVITDAMERGYLPEG